MVFLFKDNISRYLIYPSICLFSCDTSTINFLLPLLASINAIISSIEEIELTFTFSNLPKLRSSELLEDFGAKLTIVNLLWSLLTNLLSNICEAIFEQSVVLPDPLAPFTKIMSDSKILSSHGETILFAKQW